MKIHALRLKPGQDLKMEIEQYAKKRNIRAGFIVTCVAGLEKATLRMAEATPNRQDVRTFDGPVEVTSLVGTISNDGCHLHITISDKEGRAFGGHLKEQSIVYSTAEIIIGEDESKIFSRELDEQTGFDELVIKDIYGD